MYYCLYRLLVLTLGGVLLAEDRPGQKLGVSQIICRMLDLINIEFTHAGLLCHMYARFCPYHRDLQHYLDLAVQVMRVCRWRLGVAGALTFVGRAVERAATSSARVFVRGFQGKMGLCSIFQEGFGLHGYGVFACSHIMHLDCQISYEAYERGQAPHRRPECPIFQAGFDGCQCIYVWWERNWSWTRMMCCFVELTFVDKIVFYSIDFYCMRSRF